MSSATKRIGIAWAMVCLSAVVLAQSHNRKAQEPGTQLPKTVDEAVEILKNRMGPDDRDWVLRNPRREVTATLHLPFGTGVRNEFKLWGGNPELHASCGTNDAEGCSSVIFNRLWESVRSDADPELVRKLDCQFELLDRIQIKLDGFDKLTTGGLLTDMQQQIDQRISDLAKDGPRLCQSAIKINPAGDPNLSCFVRAEFAKKRDLRPVTLDLFLGWISWRNGFEVLHDPPNMRFVFDKKCVWPKRPDWIEPQ